ncbi:MAG: MATE family efflux transporter [Eubacteriales bacterium]|nr:MATE family efflux transporter [Eubacteriales bacterium]
MGTGTLSNNKAILKELFRNSFYVICLLELINSAASLTDSYFMGNYMGSLGMAAMGYARPFFSFTDIICGPLGLGMQIICSHYIGKGELGSAQKIFSGALTIGLAVSLLLAVFGYTNSTLISSMYGTGSSTAEVLPMADSYLKGLFLGVPAMVLFGILSPIVQLGSGKRIITISMFAQLIADVAGDALSIFVFQGGMFGLGLATAISYYFAVIPLLVYFFRGEKILEFRLSWMSFSDLKSISNAGASKAIKRICNTIKPIIMNALSLLLGASLALSVYSITNQVRDLLISFSAGVSSSILLIGALLYSQCDRDGLKCLSQIALSAIGGVSLLGVLCIAFSRPIANFFISDSEEVLQMAALSIRCVGIMIPFSTFNGVFISYEQIAQRFRSGRILSYLNRLILIVLTSALLGYLFGTNGLWWALPVSEFLNFVIVLLLIMKRNGKFPRKALDLLCLAPDFGFKPEDYIEITLRSKEDVTDFENTLIDFCINHEIDYRRSYFSQLALEELAMNVITHGFPKCRNTPVIHIWITYDKGDIKLRFQDNCPGFNVMKYCTELRQANPERCVGLRLISKISKEMSYVNSLETNNLIITI